MPMFALLLLVTGLTLAFLLMAGGDTPVPPAPRHVYGPSAQPDTAAVNASFAALLREAHP